MQAIPTLNTERLILKGVSIADVASYTKYFVDYDVVRYLSDEVPWPYPENGVKDHLEKVVLPQQGDGHWVWGIFLKEQPDELIGTVDLRREGKPEHRGFWLGKPFWGKGIMTEANVSVLDYAFGALGFERLLFANAVGNIGSRRIKEKTGAQLIGIREAGFVDPLLKECEVWELTPENWLKFKTAKA
ncbi:GNAT family N-acetyltransferase [Pedobacter caeni]|uniref:Protein N-acetyltransferase, RimJ/RimL family n=1 Tax=Pedobacter caeni TaxID=288992 RepID=A0A1M5IWK0_9SPHI|nr:GNAT family N-acetyltransferase [Pedobacter caeni]SHG32631.1 Protein N-acetyltransferase, RimJ/RimL family [Pedobacter caeni]